MPWGAAMRGREGVTALVLGCGLLGTAWGQDAKGADPAAPAWQQAAGPGQTFQVATVKPGRPEAEPEVGFSLGPGAFFVDIGGRFSARNVKLLDFIRFAYKLDFAQTNLLQENAPKWLSQDVYDIEARAESAQPTKDQFRLMMQALLRERFGLRVHVEQRAMPVLALLQVKPGRLGPALRPDEGTEGCRAATPGAGALAAPTVEATLCGVITAGGVPEAPSRLRVEGHRVTMADLALQLEQMGRYPRPLVDRTGLRGSYDVTLVWGPETAPEVPAAAPGSDDQTYLQEALGDQLGLRLERQVAQVPVTLIDHVERQAVAN